MSNCTMPNNVASCQDDENSDYSETSSSGYLSEGHVEFLYQEESTDEEEVVIMTELETTELDEAKKSSFQNQNQPPQLQTNQYHYISPASITCIEKNIQQNLKQLMSLLAIRNQIQHNEIQKLIKLSELRKRIESNSINNINNRGVFERNINVNNIKYFNHKNNTNYCNNARKKEMHTAKHTIRHPHNRLPHVRRTQGPLVLSGWQLARTGLTERFSGEI